MQEVILAFITAFSLTYYAIPSIIRIAKEKNLVDTPGGRRSHKEITPSLGGVGIFAGFVFSMVLWLDYQNVGGIQYLICALLILFLIGLRDDIIPISARIKLFAQLLAASILVFKSGYYLDSFHGLFGVEELSQPVAYAFSLLLYIFLINAFNLIDGINGLSGSISLIISTVAGVWFFLVGEVSLSLICFAFAGSIIGFLRYNIISAKIFMGDTGSTILGLMCAFISIEMMAVNSALTYDELYRIDSIPAVIVGIYIFPIFDTMRVFFIRIVRGGSPFKPDRRHIHHMLIDVGLSHFQATSMLVSINVVFLFIVFRFQSLGAFYLLVLIFSLAAGMTMVLHRINFRIGNKKDKIQDQNKEEIIVD
jgi:UDP-GlcNAc:undecaprenyl-phosphate GlcNAc-1-phosphate transferase